MRRLATRTSSTTAAAASQPSRLRVTIRAGVASSSTAITYTSTNVRPSPNTLSQNRLSCP